MRGEVRALKASAYRHSQKALESFIHSFMCFTKNLSHIYNYCLNKFCIFILYFINCE